MKEDARQSSSDGDAGSTRSSPSTSRPEPYAWISRNCRSVQPARRTGSRRVSTSLGETYFMSMAMPILLSPPTGYEAVGRWAVASAATVPLAAQFFSPRLLSPSRLRLHDALGVRRILVNDGERSIDSREERVARSGIEGRAVDALSDGERRDDGTRADVGHGRDATPAAAEQAPVRDVDRHRHRLLAR